jgi:hypothetical protein
LYWRSISCLLSVPPGKFQKKNITLNLVTSASFLIFLQIVIHWPNYNSRFCSISQCSVTVLTYLLYVEQSNLRN